MAYVGRDFDTMDVGESDVFALDFVNDLPPGDSIVAAATGLTVRSGTDASPASHLIQVPSFIGTKIMQRIAGLLPEVDYRLTATATTTQGNTLVLYSHVRGRAAL